jgi:hypothetical protein
VVLIEDNGNPSGTRILAPLPNIVRPILQVSIETILKMWKMREPCHFHLVIRSYGQENQVVQFLQGLDDGFVQQFYYE